MNDVQIIVRPAKLAAIQQHLRDLLDCNIFIGFCGCGIKGAAGNNEIVALLQCAVNRIQVSLIQMPGRNEQVAVFAADRLFPEQILVWLVVEPFMEGHSRSQHIRIIRLIDDRLVKGVLVDEGGGQLIKAVSAAAFPVPRLGDAAWVISGDDLVQAYLAVGVGMVAHLNADIPPPHFVGDGGGGAGAEEGVQNQVTGVGGNVDDALNKTFWLWRIKDVVYSKKRKDFFLSLQNLYAQLHYWATMSKVLLLELLTGI